MANILFMLLATYPSNLSASPQQAPTSSSPTPLSPSTSSPSSLPTTTTSSPTYGRTGDNLPNPSHTSSFLNYYFLILGFILLLILLAWWLISRRRRRALAKLETMRQSVLQEDVRCWNRHQRAEYGRRGEAETERARAREGRVDGLDESGVPPPAYVRVAERAYLGGERGGVGGKPPDYVERREG